MGLLDDEKKIGMIVEIHGWVKFMGLGWLNGYY